MIEKQRSADFAGKKILFANASFGFGGTESLLLQIFNRLVGEGADCRLLSFIDSLALAESFGIPPEKLHVLMPEQKTVPTFPQSIRQTLKLRRFLKQGNFDAVFVALYLPALPIWLATLLLGKRNVFFVLVQTGDYLRRHVHLWNSGLIRRTTRKIIALSNFLHDDYLRRFPAYAAQLTTCILPVDTDRYHPRSRRDCRELVGLPQDQKIVGMCSRIVEEKGMGFLADAMVHLKEDDILAVIYGEGPWREELQSRLNALGLTEKMLLLPPRSDTEIIYNAFDLYLQTSRWPSLGLSVLESFASGLPVLIATRDEEEVVMAKDTFAGYEAGEMTGTGPAVMAGQIKGMLNSAKLPHWQAEARRLAEDVYSWPAFLSSMHSLINQG